MLKNRNIQFVSRKCTTAFACFIAISLATSAIAGSPRVSVTAPSSFITNESQEAVYTLTLSAPSSQNVAVTFVMTGSAIQGFDYLLIGNFSNTGQVVIPAGQTSATVTLHTIPDDGNPFQEIATFNVLNGRRYHIGFPNHASIRIRPQP
jgi:hypothetical protein